MDTYRFIQVLIKQLKWLIALPLIAGIMMYVLTMNQTQEYSTHATIFTAIASGSSLNDLGNSRVDFFATKTAYNNLISIVNSRNVIEETALRLLALHLNRKEPEATILSKAAFEALQDQIPDTIKLLADPADIEQTYQNLAAYMHQDKNNYLYGLINFDHPHYSYKAISKVKTSQVGGSDIIEFRYQSDDAAVAYQTLKLLIDVFLNRYSKLKKNRTNEVIGYFERQLNASSRELNEAEDRLLKFNATNSIVNYYEQTKHISSQQEKIEIRLQEVLLEYKASEAILTKLETETHARFNINLKYKEIMDLRQKLIVTNRQLAESELVELVNPQSPVQNASLTDRKIELEIHLQNKLDSLYIYKRHSEGIAIEKLLNDWLENVVDYESAKARLVAMQAKSKEFKALYNQYAPLGATLKRIEREIDVKEKAYLEILHHLGLARLKQQNEEMMANMKLLDHPHLPIDPEPTKRKLLVIIISLFTFLFSLLGIFIFELMDKTIKTGQRYARLADINVAGAVPMVYANDSLDQNTLVTRGIKSCVEIIIKQRNGLEVSRPLVAQFLSHWQGEGKSEVMEQVYLLLIRHGFSVTKITSIPNINDSTAKTKDLLRTAAEIRSPQTAASVNPMGPSTKAPGEILLTEVPALSGQVINLMLISSASLHFLISDANRTWSSADTFLQSQLKEQINIVPIGILNKAKPANMEEMIGDIHKKRSFLRRFLKQQIVKRLLS
ncbi:MAG: hypothetical protein JEZ14_09845 [Marinilabiliaceae bacterium]|nr:hypothetical protein [Marinilabiliaceae bacterium]